MKFEVSFVFVLARYIVMHLLLDYMCLHGRKRREIIDGNVYGKYTLLIRMCCSDKIYFFKNKSQ